jgi:ankyrin repeat protein
MNEQGMTELHLAAYHGELEWLENCLKGGLSVHAKDKGGWTPLHWAVDMGMVGRDRVEVVTTLIKSGADIEAKDNEGQTPLIMAGEQGNPDIVQRLLEAGADVNATDTNGRTALINASNLYPDIVRLLLKAGADANSKDAAGRTALRIAMEEGNSEIIQQLLAAGANKSQK